MSRAIALAEQRVHYQRIQMKSHPDLRTNLLKFALGGLLAFAGARSGVAQDTPGKPGSPVPSATSAQDTALPAETAITDAQIRDIVNRVARHQVRPLAEGAYPEVKSIEEAKAAKAPEGISWSYPWGVALYGVLRSTEVTSDQDAGKFVIEHDRICGRYYDWLAGVRKSITNQAEVSAFLRTTRIRGLMSLGNLDSCGAMGNQLLNAMLLHPDQVVPGEKNAAARIADWIVNKQDRLPDGTLWRSKSMNGTVWPDDLYMACPFLIRWAQYTGDSKHLDDAANQIIQQAALEQDSDGVWFHGYFVSEKKHAPFKWGRGNGWVTVATVEVLSALPENHPARAQLLDILRKQIDGLKPLQAPDGMWRQVLDKPELWEETSCTAMFAYGIARAVNRGWIDPANMTLARKAFAGLAKHVTPDGQVNGTCRGTNIGTDLEYYINRERPDNDAHGIGPVLLAGTEILSAKQK
jgi:unsaturated rhamnogalacturonyl hydrolase